MKQAFITIVTSFAAALIGHATDGETTLVPKVGDRSKRPVLRELILNPVGQQPPPLSLEKLIQAPVEAKADWDSLRGKVVFLEFWTTWCNANQMSQQAGAEDFFTWAQSPPMGWNSWDCYGPTVREDKVRANADYMAEHLKEYGWQYVVVDIRWFVENTTAHGYNQRDPRYVMDEYGRFRPAENRFPSASGGKGFKPLADYVHSLDLKFGIHIMRGIPVEAVKKNTAVLWDAGTG